MAARFVGEDEIEKHLKCSLCFDVLDDPRNLNCSHTFCRACIDDVITFNKEGNAEITCPTCEGLTTLTTLETTKDLPKPFMFLGLLEKVKQRRCKTKLIDSCKGRNDCTSEITQWCTQCRKKFCKDCFVQHGCENKISVEGQLHVYSNTFRMTCKRHNALITKICKTCNNQHLCIYCTNFDHKEHDTLTLAAFTNNLKSQYLEKLKQTKENFQLNNFSYPDALEEAHEYKQELTIELDTRIIRKVIKYIEHLNNQKQSIILQYENIVKEWEEHLQQHGLLQDSFVNVITNAIQEVQDIETFRVVVDEVANTKKINTLTTLQSLNLTLTNDNPEDDRTLSGITFHENSGSNPVQREKIFEATEIKFNKEKCDETVQLIKKITKELEEFSSSVDTNLYLKTDILNLITNNSFDTLRRIYILDPNLLNDGGFIYSSVEHNKPKILKLLLKVQNIDIHFAADGKPTSLHLACEKGYTKIVELLIRNKAHVDEKNNDGQTPLHLASYNGHKEIVELLIRNKARVDEKDNDGETPLHDASYNGHKEIVELLIRNKARVDEKDNDGWTPLHDASYNGHKEIVELLIRNKARVDEKDDYGQTPLHRASYNGHKETVELLIRNKAHVDEKNNDGRTPLHVASYNGHKDIVELLIRNKARVDEKDNDGSTPLHRASYNGHKEIVELLIRNKARVDEKSNYGLTPLHLASYNGHKDIVELLIRNKAHVDEKDNYGSTPLHVASYNGHKDIVELLIRNKARVDEKDNYGQTPLHVASCEGHKETVELLIRNKAHVDEKNNDGRTPLHVASYNGHKDIVELLIRNKARVDEKDNYGQTPLHVASYNGHKEIVELLIRNKARVDEKNNDGRTPLHLASYNRHKEIVELLKVCNKNS